MSKLTKKKETGLLNSEADKVRFARIAEAMSNYKPSRKRLHVIYYGDHWGILREGAKRVSKICENQSIAVSYATKLALKEAGSSIIVHKRNGRPEAEIQL